MKMAWKTQQDAALKPVEYHPNTQKKKKKVGNTEAVKTEAMERKTKQ